MRESFVVLLAGLSLILCGCNAPDLSLIVGHRDASMTSCGVAQVQWSAEVERAAQGRRACTTDADCVVKRPSLECPAADTIIQECAVAVAGAEEAAFEDALSGDLCTDIVEGCRVDGGCGGNPVARCVSDRCTIEDP